MVKINWVKRYYDEYGREQIKTLDVQSLCGDTMIDRVFNVGFDTGFAQQIVYGDIHKGSSWLTFYHENGMYVIKTGSYYTLHLRKVYKSRKWALKKLLEVHKELSRQQWLARG